LPNPTQRIRSPPTHAQVADPAEFSPRHPKVKQLKAKAALPDPYPASRRLSMSRNWSSTQSPGFRE
jgi:hypothetical protein